jgi:hypothetical protein
MIQARRQLIDWLTTGLGLALLGFISLVTLLALCGGCATIPTATTSGSPAELGQPITISGLVQVGQMGMECTSQDRALKRILRDVLTSQGAPAPQKIAVKALPGASLCGLAQGMSNELGTPELGARYMARAEVSLYWSDITERDLRMAQKAFALLRATHPTHPHPFFH